VRRGNEFAVGLAVLAALALVVGGALWLSERDIKGKYDVYVARFRTVGGLGVGAPVTLRGVRVGRVEAIRLARDAWVEAELTVEKDVTLPQRPAVISASNSLFGEWAANIIPLEPLPEEPGVRAALLESDAEGGDALPGATLPDIGELTAQASRIAGDVADVTQRIRLALDSAAIRELRQSVLDLASIANKTVRFADAQTTRLDRVGASVATSAEAFAGIAQSFERTVARIDTATNRNQFADIVDNTRASSADLRAAAADEPRPGDPDGRLPAHQDAIAAEHDGPAGHRLDALRRDHGVGARAAPAARRHPGEPAEVPQDLRLLMSKRRAELEVSAGGIVFRRLPDRSALYLLIRDSYDNWGFPKGHLEDGETPAVAALRETGEETGLSDLALHGPIRVIDWHFRFRGRHIHKFCHFFLFESVGCEPVPQLDEGITACAWHPLEGALQTLSYDNARGVLKRASEMVRTLVAVGAGRPKRGQAPVER
jgi:phospholipid/cholesterol/gamma-HCH transport system substrate-binding protein